MSNFDITKASDRFEQLRQAIGTERIVYPLNILCTKHGLSARTFMRSVNPIFSFIELNEIEWFIQKAVTEKVIKATGEYGIKELIDLGIFSRGTAAALYLSGARLRNRLGEKKAIDTSIKDVAFTRVMGVGKGTMAQLVRAGNAPLESIINGFRLEIELATEKMRVNEEKVKEKFGIIGSYEPMHPLLMQGECSKRYAESKSKETRELSEDDKILALGKYSSDLAAEHLLAFVARPGVRDKLIQAREMLTFRSQDNVGETKASQGYVDIVDVHPEPVEVAKPREAIGSTSDAAIITGEATGGESGGVPSGVKPSKKKQRLA